MIIKKWRLKATAYTYKISVYEKSHPPLKKTIAYKNDVYTILQTPFWILCFAVHCPTEVRRVDEKQAMNRCVAY